MKSLCIPTMKIYGKNMKKIKYLCENKKLVFGPRLFSYNYIIFFYICGETIAGRKSSIHILLQILYMCQNICGPCNYTYFLNLIKIIFMLFLFYTYTFS